MKSENAVQTKSFDFAVRIVKLSRYLQEEKREFVLSKQLLRAGTSIGANIEESIGAQSDKDFVAKLTIAYKEARESSYWLKLLFATDYLTTEQFHSLQTNIEELCRIISSILITMKTKMNNNNV